MSNLKEKELRALENDCFALLKKYGYKKEICDNINIFKENIILLNGFDAVLSQMLIVGGYDNKNVTIFGFTRSQILKILAYIEENHPGYLDKIKENSK